MTAVVAPDVQAPRLEAAQQRHRTVQRVLWATLFLNWAVAAGKLVYGYAITSAAMQADGLHSFIDGGSNVIGLVAMRYAAQPPDREHPYGHHKFEALASLAIGVMIGMGVLELGRIAFDSLVRDVHPTPTVASYAVMVVTLLVNITVSRVEAWYGRRLHSTLLTADAQHTLSDVFVTLAVLASLGLSRLGVPRADGAVALLVLAFVGYTGFSILSQSIGFLSDSAQLDPEAVRAAAAARPSVLRVRDVRSRGLEGAVHVDLKVEVDGSLDTHQAHQVSTDVEAALMQAFPQVVDVVVHIEPASARG
jgi:cation diffusion facilitator family transporter